MRIYRFTLQVYSIFVELFRNAFLEKTLCHLCNQPDLAILALLNYPFIPFVFLPSKMKKKLYEKKLEKKNMAIKIFPNSFMEYFTRSFPFLEENSKKNWTIQKFSDKSFYKNF